MESLQDRVLEDKITIRTIPISPPRRDSFRANWFSATLRRGNQVITVPYGMGLAFDGPPSAVAVLQSLLSDSDDIEDRDFGEWAGEFGLETDDPYARRIYKSIEAQTSKLRRFLGSDFDTYLNTERD